MDKQFTFILGYRFAVQISWIFLIGHVIKEKIETFKNKKWLIYTVGFISILAAFIIRKGQSIEMITNLDAYSYVSNFSPFIAVYSLAFFIIVSVSGDSTNNWTGKLGKLTFYIYLIHLGVWNILGRVFEKIDIPLLTLTIAPIVIFFFSLFLLLNILNSGR